MFVAFKIVIVIQIYYYLLLFIIYFFLIIVRILLCYRQKMCLFLVLKLYFTIIMLCDGIDLNDNCIVI